MKGRLRLIALGLALAATAGIAADTPQQTVDYRIDLMKRMGGKVNEAFQLSGTDAAGAQAKLAIAVNLAQAIPQHFPAGTFDGDAGVKTRALPKIGTDKDGFQKAVDTLLGALYAADSKVEAKDSAGVDAAFAEVRKACGGCHEQYRGPAK